ncbi:MAG TPA: monofunctional biosynthetic peptidoglycan transglycosylase [Ignavibacteriaceae bacterium]
MNKSNNPFRKIFKKVLKTLLKVLITLFVLSVLSVLSMKWIDPFTSSIMIQRKISAIFSDKTKPEIKYNWFDYDDISKQMAISVIAAEDQNFPFHFGFDMEQIGKALDQNKKGRRVRGASTITQQVAKNLFLWEGKSYFRKALEAYFTVLIEIFWSKERIIEVYLNIAETGNMIFGVGEASRIYFRKIPGKLTATEAALIAATLPNPKRYSAKRPSGYVLMRQGWILNQMSSLGGKSYLDNL